MVEEAFAVVVAPESETDKMEHYLRAVDVQRSGKETARHDQRSGVGSTMKVEHKLMCGGLSLCVHHHGGVLCRWEDEGEEAPKTCAITNYDGFFGAVSLLLPFFFR